jgi:tRNA(Ile)-lysidine synthase
MVKLLESVRRTIRHYGLLPPGSRVIAALSGGADSVGLLLLLQELASTEGFFLSGAAHLNHQLRGVEADRDEAFCRQFTAARGVPLYVETADVGARAVREGVSVEEAAHHARAEFYVRAADNAGASAVAVAHTKDDQAETFLLRLLRGAGPRGLGGMHPRSGLVVRPLLETARSDIRAFVAGHGVEFREDASNADTAIPRNRVRHELIPLLESTFSAGITDVLARESVIAREDAEYLDHAAATAAARLLVRSSVGVELPIKDVLALPPAIGRRVVRLAQQAASEGRFVGFDAVEALLRFAVSKSSGALDLPGHRVNRRGGRLVLTKSTGRGARTAPVAFSYELRVPGTVRVSEAHCLVSAEIGRMPEGRRAADRWQLSARGDEAVVDAGRLRGPLVIRNRRAGDRLQPLGLGGHKKLHDVFVDAKVERTERDRIPLVVDSAGQIVWVAGHSLAEPFRVTDGTTAVVILRRVNI